MAWSARNAFSIVSSTGPNSAPLAFASALPFGWGDTRVGWTVGAGAEVAIDRNWSVKIEYLYMDLGSFGGSSSATVVTNALNTPAPAFNTVTTTTTTGFNTRFTDNIVRVGFNYRFGGPVIAKY